DDALLAQVRAGEKRGSEACLDLLRDVTLNGHAAVESRSAEILRTFQAFHMTWFSTKDLVRQETENPTSEIFDVDEMGYHLTYDLFAPKTKYSDVVTRASSFRGIRVARAPATNLVDPDGAGECPKLTERKWGLGEKKETTRPWNPKRIAFGDLVGIAPMAARENPASYIDPDGRRLEFDSAQSFGGGVLGTVPYVMLTTSLPQYHH